ncbi:MAG: NAD(P)H-dependent glycerol-3-phosphate dehydrogenase [Gammaproteobacteria bacterium]
MRIAVFGAGAWGTALATHAGARHEVLLWTRDAALAATIGASRVNARYLPGVALPLSIGATADLDDACSWLGEGPDAVVVLATSVAGMRPMLQVLAERLQPGIAGLVWLCKGIERDTSALPHRIAAETLPGLGHAVLSGPSFAQEVAAGLPVALTVASRVDFLRRAAQNAFHHGSARIYGSDDIIGVELGGALKNVIAIAAGISDGLQLGNNARAALITRGLAEIARLGVAMGARATTFTGLTGLGDLVLTCTGDLSRNRRVGLALAAEEPLAQIVERLGHVAEGVPCAGAALALAAAHHVELPIVAAVQAVLEGRRTPNDAVRELLARQPRDEQRGA